MSFLTVLSLTLKKNYSAIDFPVVKDINKNEFNTKCTCILLMTEILGTRERPQHERDGNTSRKLELIPKRDQSGRGSGFIRLQKRPSTN